jgi:hypothetical protein
MLRVACAHSIDIDESDAVAELLQQLVERLDGHRPQAGLLFVGAERDTPQVLRMIRERLPDLHLIGCSSDAELCTGGEAGMIQDSITLMVFASDVLRFAVGMGQGASTDPEGAGRAAIEMMMAGGDEPPALVITTPEGVRSNVERMLGGMNDALTDGVPIFGGTASDHFTMQDTRQLFGGEVLQDAAVVLGFFGPLKLGSGVASGWKPIGRRMMITESAGNMVRTIDHQPATEIFQGLLDDLDIVTRGEHPLALYTDPGSDEHALRGAFQVDIEQGLLYFATDMPHGAEVKLTWFEMEDIIKGASDSLSAALEGYPGEQPEAVMVFTCCARKSVMGLQAAREFCVLQGALPRPDLPMIGFYSYGEIAPAVSGRAMFHNETCITVVIGTT